MTANNHATEPYKYEASKLWTVIKFITLSKGPIRALPRLHSTMLGQGAYY